MKSAKAIVAVTSAAAALLACGRGPVEQNVDPVEQNDAPQVTLFADSVVLRLGDEALSPRRGVARDA